MTMTRRAFCAGHTSVPLARPAHTHEDSLLTAKAVTVQLVPRRAIVTLLQARQTGSW